MTSEFTISRHLDAPGMRDAITIELPDLELRSEANIGGRLREKWARKIDARTTCLRAIGHLVGGTASEIHAADLYRDARTRKRLAPMFVRLAMSLRAKAERLLPATITIERSGPGWKPLDTGNLWMAIKAAQDGIAGALVIDDADTRVMWVPVQRRAPWGVVIRIEQRRDGGE